MRRLRFKRTTLITVFCVALLAGLGLARKANIQFEYALLLLPIAIVIKGKSLASLLLVIILGAVIGLWRGGEYMQNVHRLQSLAEQKVTVEATATSDSFYGTQGQIQFTGGNITMLYPYAKPVAGSFKLSGFGEKMIYRGDRVRVSGKLYPSRGSNQATIAYAQLNVLSHGESAIYSLTRRFDAGMENALPEPQSSFGLGLLIGQRTTMPAQVTAALTAVGLVHIVAVSGYNLTIIVRGISRLRLGSKYQKLILSLSLIAGFVLVTGFSASIVRAAIVSILTLWAWYYGRQIKPLVLICFAAAATALWNPYYLWGDIGWYLSFLAFFGVLVIAPVITARFFKHEPKILTSVIIETLSAEIMTLPLILMTFSQLSIVALIANTLIVPLVPLAMLLSAAAAGAGSLIPQFAGWFALPARLLLTYMLDVIHMLSSIPSVLIHRSISLTSMVGIYCGAVALLVLVSKKLPKPQRKFDEPIQITP